MEYTTVERIQEAKTLFEQRRFREGLQLINAVDSTSFTGDQRIQVSLVKAELDLNLGIIPAEDEITTALAYYKTSTDTAGYAKAKFLHGWLLTRQGNFADAREILLEAYVHYKRCDEFLKQAKVLSKLCFVLLTLGDIENAIRYLLISIAYITNSVVKITPRLLR